MVRIKVYLFTCDTEFIHESVPFWKGKSKQWSFASMNSCYRLVYIYYKSNQISLARNNFKLHFLFTYPTSDLPTSLHSYHPPSTRSPSILSVRMNNEVTTSNFLIEIYQTIYPSLPFSILCYPLIHITLLHFLMTHSNTLLTLNISTFEQSVFCQPATPFPALLFLLPLTRPHLTAFLY